MIDCSNRSTVHRKMEQSQAEYLESLLPTSSKVVKAFNVLSAYSLESGGIQGIYIYSHLPNNRAADLIDFSGKN